MITCDNTNEFIWELNVLMRVSLRPGEEYVPHCTRDCEGTICPCWQGECRACVRSKGLHDPFGDLVFRPPHPAEVLPHLCEMTPFPCL